MRVRAYICVQRMETVPKQKESNKKKKRTHREEGGEREGGAAGRREAALLLRRETRAPVYSIPSSPVLPHRRVRLVG